MNLIARSVFVFEFLDTPGDEVAPGSDEVGKHFENERLGHNPSVFGCYPFGIIGFYCSWLAEVKGLSLFGEIKLRGSGIQDLCSTLESRTAANDARNSRCPQCGAQKGLEPGTHRLEAADDSATGRPRHT